MHEAADLMSSLERRREAQEIRKTGKERGRREGGGERETEKLIHIPN